MGIAQDSDAVLAGRSEPTSVIAFCCFETMASALTLMEEKEPWSVLGGTLPAHDL